MKSNFMLNVEKDLWEIYNAFRSVMEIDKAKNYHLSMNTLKYLSENNDHPFDIPFRSQWQQVSSHGINIGNRLNEAFREIEKLNPPLKGIWTISDFSAIPDKILFEVATILNKYSFERIQMDDPDPLTGTFPQYTERIFEVIMQREGASGGESSSPEDVAELLVQLLNIKHGSIYDGAAGLNDFLIESCKQAVKIGGWVRIFGQELNPQTWALGKMNFLLHGLYPDDAETKLGHTIINPLWKTDSQNLMQFDGILSNPPFGLGNWGHKEALNDLYGRFRYGVPSKSTGDMAFVQHSIASLKSTGKAALVVPHGALFRGATEGKIREQIIKEDIIEAVIGLPANLFYGTGIPTAILIINKNKKEELKNKILIINAEEGFEKGRVKNALRQEDMEKIIRTYLNLNEVEGYSTLVDVFDIQQNDWNLLPLRYFDRVEVETDIGKVKVHKDRYGQLIRKNLGEIADVQRGINVSKDEFEEINPSHYLINLSNVDKNGNIVLEDIRGVKLSPKKAKEYELVPGDILISSRGTALKVTVIGEMDLPLVFSSNFTRIKLYDNQKYSPSFIKIFLEGPIGQYYLKAFQTGTVVTVLSTKDIASITIPEVPFERQVEVSEQILKSDQEYEEMVKAAQKNKEEGYLKGYQLMGIEDAFEMVKEDK